MLCLHSMPTILESPRMTSMDALWNAISAEPCEMAETWNGMRWQRPGFAHVCVCGGGGRSAWGVFVHVKFYLRI